MASGTPKWLQRVEDSEMQTLLRASSNYSRKGYDEALFLKKQRLLTRAQKKAGRQFENGVLSSLPGHYVHLETGRSLTTELPRARPMSVARAPSALSAELQGARDVLARRDAGSGPPPEPAPLERDQAEARPSGLSRVPLSKLQGLVYHDVSAQPIHLRLSPSSPSSLHPTDGRQPDRVQDPERQEMPKASAVLRRYRMFGAGASADEPSRNLAEMMHLRSAEQLLPGSRDPPGPPPPSAGHVMASNRAALVASRSTTDLAPPAGSRPASSWGQGSGVSHAILQNRLGGTQGLAPGPVLPRGGSGLVVGDLLVAHDQLTPATLVAAKWGRISSTTYAKTPSEPCRLRCELQPIFFESLIADLRQLIGPDRFEFRADVEPAVFLVDIGSANEAVHGHRPSDVRPARIGVGQALLEGGGGTPATASAPDTGANVDEGGDAAGLSRADLAGVAGDDDESPSLEGRAQYQKRKKKARVISEDDVRRGELRMAMDAGKVQANDLLLAAASKGDVEALENLLQRGHKINYDPNPWYVQLAEKTTAKKLAARSSRFGDPESPGGGGHGDADAAVLALPDQQGAALAGGAKLPALKPSTEVFVLPDVNFTDSAGNTPLMLAARSGWLEACVALLREGADFRRKNARGATAFDLAKTESNMASMALHMAVPGSAARKRRAAKLVQVLDDRTVLSSAQKGDMRRLEHLVDDLGHPVMATNQYGMTPLHFAVMRRDIPMITFLSERGADISARNNLGQTPLSFVVSDFAGDVLQPRLLAALHAGDEKREALAMQAKSAEAESERQRAEEQKLVSTLRATTRGTTAAKAVQAAFSGSQRLNPSFAPKLVAGVIGADLDEAAHHYHERPQTSLSAPAHPQQHSGGGHGGHRLVPTGSGSGPVSGSAASHRSHMQHHDVMLQGSGLTESWNRHVLQYLGAQKDRAQVLDAARKRREQQALDDEHANRVMRDAAARSGRLHGGARSFSRRRGNASGNGSGTDDNDDEREDRSFVGQAPGTREGDRLAETHERGNKFISLRNQRQPRQQRHRDGIESVTAVRAEEAIRHALADPDGIKEDTLRLEPVPDPSSRRFESWARMRFGVLR